MVFFGFAPCWDIDKPRFFLFQQGFFPFSKKGGTMTDCIFCKIAAGEIDSDKVYEDDSYVAFQDLNPQAPTHILVIPRRHIAAVADLEAADEDLMGGLFRIAAKICKEQGIRDYRLVINNGEGVGQTVFHIHLHVLAGRAFGWPPG